MQLVASAGRPRRRRSGRRAAPARRATPPAGARAAAARGRAARPPRGPRGCSSLRSVYGGSCGYGGAAGAEDDGRAACPRAGRADDAVRPAVVRSARPARRRGAPRRAWRRRARGPRRGPARSGGRRRRRCRRSQPRTETDARGVDLDPDGRLRVRPRGAAPDRASATPCGRKLPLRGVRRIVESCWSCSPSPGAAAPWAPGSADADLTLLLGEPPAGVHVGHLPGHQPRLTTRRRASISTIRGAGDPVRLLRRGRVQAVVLRRDAVGARARSA